MIDLATVSFEYDRDDQAADIMRCLQTLILTPEGTVPLDRNFGIDNGILGYPTEVVKNLLTVELIEKTAIYEPRVIIRGVELEPDPKNPEKINVKVVYDYNGYSAIGF